MDKENEKLKEAARWRIFEEEFPWLQTEESQAEMGETLRKDTAFSNLARLKEAI